MSRSRSEVVVTRAGTWSSNRSLEWARRLGASPPKRMIASWSGPSTGQPNTRMQREVSRANGGLPSVRSNRPTGGSVGKGGDPNLIKRCAVLATVNIASSRHGRLLPRASHRTVRAGHAYGSLDWYVRIPRHYGATATEPTDYEANSMTCAMVIPRLLLPLISY
jgi:hypothetical protein